MFKLWCTVQSIEKNGYNYITSYIHVIAYIGILYSIQYDYFHAIFFHFFTVITNHLKNCLSFQKYVIYIFFTLFEVIKSLQNDSFEKKIRYLEVCYNNKLINATRSKFEFDVSTFSEKYSSPG